MNTPEIEREAQALLQECGAYRAPVSLDLVFSHLGLVAQARALADASGVLVVEGGRGVIGYNALHSPLRQRFTMAHEIGHYVLHVKSNRPHLFIDKSVYRRDEESSTGNDSQEVEANKFAAALLMPAALVRGEVEKSEFDLEDDDHVSALARRFKVSTAAMSFRLGNIGLLHH